MKKLLAFVLFAVMLLGMIPMAGAASFKDSKDVTIMTKEAVNIMSDLKIITGFPEGTFKPDDTLTRAQAAKILCCVALGVKAADELPAGGATFADVPASHWANKYVEYCASKSIVAGVGDGKFNPDGKLTGYAFGKMLLVALGADASTLTGAEWDKNTQAQLAEKHLDYGVTVNDKELSRQNACRLALNALFDGEKDDPSNMLAYKSFGVSRSSSGNSTKSYRRPVIKYVSNEADAYWKGSEKKVFASPVYLRKSGSIKGGALVKALGVSDIELSQLIVYRNGVQGDFSKSKDSGLHTDSTTTYLYSGNGVRLEVYYAADTDKWTIIHLFYYSAKIQSVVEPVIGADGTVETAGSVTFENGWKCESNDFKQSDVGNYALIYGNGKKSMNTLTEAVEAFPGTIVTGKLEKYDSKKGLTVDGKAYKYPAYLGKMTPTAKTYATDGGAVGDTVKVLLSDDGYAIMVWKAE